MTISNQNQIKKSESAGCLSGVFQLFALISLLEAPLFTDASINRNDCYVAPAVPGTRAQQ